jgi:hypothetical protein
MGVKIKEKYCHARTGEHENEAIEISVLQKVRSIQLQFLVRAVHYRVQI